jgi:ribosomal protein L20A (L18A)
MQETALQETSLAGWRAYYEAVESFKEKYCSDTLFSDMAIGKCVKETNVKHSDYPGYSPD